MITFLWSRIESKTNVNWLQIGQRIGWLHPWALGTGSWFCPKKWFSQTRHIFSWMASLISKIAVIEVPLHSEKLTVWYGLWYDGVILISFKMSRNLWIVIAKTPCYANLYSHNLKTSILNRCGSNKMALSVIQLMLLSLRWRKGFTIRSSHDEHFWNSRQSLVT